MLRMAAREGRRERERARLMSHQVKSTLNRTFPGTAVLENSAAGIRHVRARASTFLMRDFLKWLIINSLQGECGDEIP
jgi:hypothetical protein